jgi:hypothetical protein
MPIHRAPVAAALFALATAFPAAAQEADEGPALPPAGTAFLGANFGGGGGTVHVGRRVGERTRLEVGLGSDLGRTRVDDEAEGTHDGSSLALRLGVRRYAPREGRVIPFAAAGVSGFWHERRSRAEGYEATARGGGVRVDAGGGAEWFPFRNVAIDARTGVGLTASRIRQRTEYTEVEPREAVVRSLHLSTFTTSLGLNLYF